MTDPFRDEAQSIAALEHLELIGPDEAVDWASEHVAERESEALLALAVLQKPAGYHDIAPHLDDLLRELGLEAMDDHRAGQIVARSLARRVLDGSIEPVVAARRIWWDIVNRIPSLRQQLGEFVGLASEWEDHSDYRQEYDDGIVKAAHRLLSD